MKRRGTAKPSQEGLKAYTLTRSYNIRVFEKAMCVFPSDEEAVLAATYAHMYDLIDANGHNVHFERICEDEASFIDLAWVVDKITPTSNDPLAFTPIVDGAAALRDGYVMSEDVVDLIEAMAGLDPDWPGDMRAVKAAIHYAKELSNRLKAQAEYE
jgi:hypothetical protein